MATLLLVLLQRSQPSIHREKDFSSVFYLCFNRSPSVFCGTNAVFEGENGQQDFFGARFHAVVSNKVADVFSPKVNLRIWAKVAVKIETGQMFVSRSICVQKMHVSIST